PPAACYDGSELIALDKEFNMSSSIVPQMPHWILVAFPTVLGIAISIWAVSSIPAFGVPVGANLGGPTAGTAFLFAGCIIGFCFVVGLALASSLGRRFVSQHRG